MTVRVLLTHLRDEERAHAGARAAAERVRDLEALEAVAPEWTQRARPKSYHVYMEEDRAEEVRFVAAALRNKSCVRSCVERIRAQSELKRSRRYAYKI